MFEILDQTHQRQPPAMLFEQAPRPGPSLRDHLGQPVELTGDFRAEQPQAADGGEEDKADGGAQPDGDRGACRACNPVREPAQQQRQENGGKDEEEDIGDLPDQQRECDDGYGAQGSEAARRAMPATSGGMVI
jgi:hypothetical protein